jgi:iron complex transport system permease protein
MPADHPRRRAAAPLALLAALALALFLGRYPAPGFLDPALLWSDPMAHTVFFSLRLPRVLAALLLGMSLGGAGNAFQMIFGNPLVEPGFLGVSQGAAFGAALAMSVGLAGSLAVPGLAFVFAFGLLGLSVLLAGRFRFGGQVLRLVLAGIAVSALGSAGLALLKYLADPVRQLPDIIFWTMGGLSGITWQELLPALPVVLAGLAVLLALRWRITILSLDDATAHSLGVRPRRERLLILTAAVAAVAGMTALSGITAWTGLIVPHMARRLAGADGRHSMPAAMLLGGAFVLASDTLARLVLPGELPLGIVTSLAGALLFSILLLSRGLQVVR